MKLYDIDTPAMIIDYNIMMENIKAMQDKANKARVNLRPHTKTHRTPALAKLQLEAGARGITVAKLGEAEVMAHSCIDDIFIANNIVGEQKLERLKLLRRRALVSVAVDCNYHVDELEKTFHGENSPIDVLIELEVGENRAGVVGYEDLINLAKHIDRCLNVRLKGIFAHEGQTYNCLSVEQCIDESIKCQEYVIKGAEAIRRAGIDIDVVSIGATPSMLTSDILYGITEVRPGTYIFMDVCQGSVINDYSKCAASVLSTVTSKPTEERVIIDAGVKALTCYTNPEGICKAKGYGKVIGFEDRIIDNLYDEHGIINSKVATEKLQIGDKIRIIPNHICPTCNLYSNLYIVKEGEVIDNLPVLCQGKSK